MSKQKTILTLIAILVLNVFSQGSVPLTNSPLHFKIDPSKKHSLSQKDNLRIIQMKFYTNLSLKDYQTLKGKKLNFFEKQLFKTSQRRMKKILKSYEDGDGPTMLQKLSWLFKGILLGPIAVLLAYIFLKDEERELIKWTWFGFIGFAVLVLLVLLSLQSQ